MLYRQKIASVWIRNLSRGLNRVQETGSRNVKRVEVINLVTSYHPQVHFSTGQFPPTQLVHQPIYFKLEPFLQQEKYKYSEKLSESLIKRSLVFGSFAP